MNSIKRRIQPANVLASRLVPAAGLSATSLLAARLRFQTLAAFLVVLEAAWLRTGEAVYFALYRFWSKLFALAFGIGVVTGLVLSYEFGTNWSEFSRVAGNVLGPLMGYEVLTAFFLEAGFLGIMLFGLKRVGRRLHFFATCRSRSAP
jgi:cytochrome d ubiquinol oxidase subunit I